MTSRPTIGACDNCKRRKVKCDTTNPCANCRTSQIACQYRAVPRKRGRPAKAAPRASSWDEPGESVETDPVTLMQDDTDIFEQDAPVSTTQVCMTATVPALRAEPGLTCQTATSLPGSQGSPTALRSASRNVFALNAAQIFRELVFVVSAQLPDPNDTVAACARRCVDAFMRYIFPNTPIAHEPTLRTATTLFDAGPGGELFDEQPTTENLKLFSLITALCALVISAMPQELLRARKALIWPFYYASRSMLRVYEEYDLEFPDSSSYYIRMWQSAALQNTTGRDRASWHIHGEGILLAVRARLYDEETISRLPLLEAHLLRANFWLMYLADKTAAAFEARPCMIHGDYLTDRLTLREQGDHQDLLLDQSRAHNGNFLESRLIMGFHLKRRLWAAAADLIREIRLFANRDASYHGLPLEISPTTGGAADPDVAKLAEMYRDFVGYVDDLPSWLRSPDQAEAKVLDGPVDPHVVEYQATSFWAQRSNIMSVFHCMKLVVLQKCLDVGVPSVVGLGGEPVSWALHKLEIARDFLREVQIVPFACFKVQGEPAVERVRRVGSILLSIVNDAPSHTTELRARKLFEQLLDVLARLDSKASDELETLECFAYICQ